MVFRRRKLLNDSVQIIAMNCTHFCDPKTNKDGLCPLPCLPFCFATCKSTLLLPQDPPPPPAVAADFASHQVKHFRVSLFLTVFLSMLATSFFLFSFYTVHKFYRNWRSGGSGRSEQQRDDGDGDGERFSDFVDEDHGLMVDHPIWYIRTVGLQSSIINAITVCKYKRGEGLVEGTDCAVCLNEFQEDETLRLLPKCNHAFHIPCIDTWLRSHTNCPLCRAGIVSNTEAAAAPAAEQSSVPVHETQGEEQIEIENLQEGFEEQVEMEGESSNEEIRVNSPAEKEEDEAQIGIKRSFSLDSVSALMVSAAVVKAFADESSSAGSKSAMAESNAHKKAERQKGSSSTSSSSSLMPELMKRSLSCGGKIFSSRYNRRPGAILPR